MVRIFSRLRGRNKKPTFDVVQNDNSKIVLNYRFDPNLKPSRRALISYLVDPIVDNQNKTPTLFSNHGLALTWAKILIDVGYTLDIVNWDDKEFVPTESYDLFVGHGAVNFDRVYDSVKSNSTKVVYFSTGSYWRFHNQQEKLREEYFYKRHHKKISAGRLINNSEERANRLSDALVCLGNEHVKETYSEFDNVYPINISAYPDKTFLKRKRDYKSNRQNFLFLAGGGNVHKGLDLVIDVFAKLPEYQLHIITALDDEFANYYSRELSLPNIHSYGYVPIKSKEFYDIVYQCNHLVFPSCSEGSPGSVVDAMQQGIVPILTKESNIDIDDVGYVLADYKIETITNTVLRAANSDLEETVKRSQKAYELTTTKYSVETFENNLKQILSKVLAK